MGTKRRANMRSLQNKGSGNRDSLPPYLHNIFTN
uniref:Uncharacterized protein n=1 Tax=Anguilla anguilla TaxID=7936 RepID=A0A0E9XMD3_ANGAN